MTTPPSTIRVMLVDDHKVIREGLEMLLANADGVEVVAAVGSGKAAVDLCPLVRPDVVLMDMSLPDLDGTSATRLILERDPRVQVLVLTAFLEEDILRGVLDAGARGYLLKSVGRDELVAAVRAAKEGRATVDPAALPLLFRSHREPTLGHDLTGREREVLAKLATGRTNREIGRDLGISSGTVRVYVSNVLAKLGATNRTEAATIALRHGLVDMPTEID